MSVFNLSAQAKNSAFPKEGWVVGTTGIVFHVASCSHVYTYDGHGNLVTDTANDGGNTHTKTFTYTLVSTVYELTAESFWVFVS